jgi:diguanylate cyclase (GGDEF)-like protein
VAQVSAESKASATRRLQRLTVAISLATIAVAVTAAIVDGHRPDLGVVVLFGSASLLAENAALILPSSVRISPGSMFVLAAISALNGKGTVAGAMIIGALGYLVVSHLRRRRWTVVVFNCSQYSLSAAAAAGAYLLLVDLRAPLLVDAIVTSAVFALVNMALVVPAGSLESGEPWGRVWADLRPAVPNDLALGVLGILLGRLYVDVSPIAVIALVTLAVVAHSALLAVVRFRQAYGRLETLYGFTLELERSQDEHTTVASVLRQARQLLKAEMAELTVVAEGTDWGRRTTLSGGPGAVPVAVEFEGRPPELDAAVEATVLLSETSGDEGPLSRLLAERGLRDAMIAALRIEGAVVGSLMVANRVPEVDEFTSEELRLFETLTNHAAVSIENSRLLDRLRWDSRHDRLTGLANRTAFNELIEQAVRQLPATSAVLLIDLDRFKEVNDTLGHHHGDLLLREVANRLSEHVGPTGTVARLGGDEFGVLLPGASTSDAAQAAVGLLAALEQPFTAGQLNLEATGSIGAALLPADGREPITLLQRAEVAMYAAKEDHSGWEAYDRKRDHYNPRRLVLAGELRQAIESGQMEVYYQPKANLQTGEIKGLEALLRWRNPREGLLRPDDFIPIAERAGLIRPLTLLVLRDAARQCRALAEVGFELDVAINLSVRTVLDVNLPDHVETVMSEFGLPARALTAEITESSVMADPGRTIGVLGRLSALGVSIAIDDFGTGYSSLSYLKRLPVNEIKIDHSFVTGMLVDDNDAVIVRSIIDLAHNLGLRVVAEGVEDQATWNRLAQLGCDLAQGFHLSPPVAAAQLLAVLRHARTST